MNIVLQTDFSNTWGGVASMKGIIKSVNDSLDIIDLTHDIDKFNVFEASLSLHRVIPYWPSQTIFISVVDPGVGSERLPLACLTNSGKYIFSPDNGSLTHMKKHIAQSRIIDWKYGLRNEGSVFDGRDLFANAAALLADEQITFEELGKEYPVEYLSECEEYSIRPFLELHKTSGFIMTGNRHFGGIELNIKNKDFDNCDFDFGDKVNIVIKNNECILFDEEVKYHKAFSFVSKGKAILYPGSSGFLSLDINQGHFMNTYNVNAGKDYQVIISKKL